MCLCIHKLQSLQTEYADIQQRAKERLDWLKKEREHAIEALDKHQANEKTLLIERGPEALMYQRKRELKPQPVVIERIKTGQR